MDKNGNSGGRYKAKRVSGKTEYVHRIIAGAKNGEIVDHIDGDKSNNNAENLRIVSKSQNNRNRESKGFTITKYGKYQVTTSYENKTYFVGNYDTEKDAKMVHKAVSKILFEITGIKVKEEVEEMTMEDVCKALGKTIKIKK